MNTSAVLDYDVYSPDLFNNILYLGGWLTQADIGPDQLYRSSPATDSPTPIAWTGAAPYGLYHLNDPSVVREANGTLAMFMTALPNAYGYSSEMTSRNVTGLATSADNGQTWTWQGIVIGQNNGIDGTGAWSPSAMVNAGGIAVWYHTGATDVNTGAAEPTRVFRTEMDPTGTRVLATVQCIDTATGQDLSAANVDVQQAADGTYWMVANDFSSADGDVGKIVLYQSQGGVSWTPWSSSGATLLSPQNGSMLLTPTITSISGNSLNLMYGEQVGSSATVEQSLNVALSNQPVTPHFAESNVFNGVQTSTVDVAGQVYSGPATNLQNQLVYTGSDNVNLHALTANVYLCSGSGQDALAALSGNNVLDGGTGSTFFRAGAGNDVFYLDAGVGINTWSTINAFKAGDQLMMWDVTSSMANMIWSPSQGAPSALGATMHIPEGGGHYASLTLAGWSVQAAQSLTASFGAVNGRASMHLTT